MFNEERQNSFTMFRKIEKTSLVFLEDNDFFYNDDYASVMQFISKNKQIPQAIENFDNSSDELSNISELHNDFKKGKFQTTIYNHPNCQLYSLYLLKHNKLSIDDFLSINLILIAFMQFSAVQQLAKQDFDVKRSGEIGFVKFAEIKNLIITAIKNNHFNRHPYEKFDEKDLEDKIASMSSSEDFLIALTFEDTEPDMINQILEDLSTLPLLYIDYPSEKKTFYIPSAAIKKTVIEIINNDSPLQMAPIFGEIHLNTLYQMHQKGFHPVSLYSPHVLTNPKKIHGHRFGPLPTLLHDSSAHYYSGNLLANNHYQFIYHYLIPTVAKYYNIKINEIEAKSFDLPSLFCLIDLNIISIFPVDKQVKFEQSCYLKAALWHALGEKETEIGYFDEELLIKIIKDKQFIYKNYKIDIKMLLIDLLNDTTFLNNKTNVGHSV